MNIYLHQTHHTLGDFDQTFGYLKEQIQQAEKGVHLFTECFLFGYPAQDLYLQPDFIHRYKQKLEEVSAFCHRQKKSPSCLFLIGGVEYRLSSGNIPQTIRNSIYQASPGTPLTPIYHKQVLPYYDIFDDYRYFTPGTENKVMEFFGKKIGLLICEDMWHSAPFTESPIQKWCNKKTKLDLIVNLSASPFHIEKSQQRAERAKSICQMLKAPLAYVNRVGGEDEILFDGESFVFDGHTMASKAPSFKTAKMSCQWPIYNPGPSPQKIKPKAEKKAEEKEETSAAPWEALYQPRLDHQSPPKLQALSEKQLEKIVTALRFGLQEYASISERKSFLIALSGGLDSALVLALAHLATREQNLKLEALLMPGSYSSPMSREQAEKMCQSLCVPFKIVPIKFLHASCRHAFLNELKSPLKGVADENIQSRLRGTLLYARSNQTGSLVLNTSNKSEISVGYSTQYGDSVGALSPLGDLYKSELYPLAHHLNRHHDTLIPEEIIQRPPTAELRANQTDQDSLPPYSVLDAILEGLLSYGLSTQKLIELGHREEEVKQVKKLFHLAEHKRRQFCPIIKVKPKSLGIGYRVPVLNYSKSGIEGVIP